MHGIILYFRLLFIALAIAVVPIAAKAQATAKDLAEISQLHQDASGLPTQAVDSDGVAATWQRLADDANARAAATTDPTAKAQLFATAGAYSQRASDLRATAATARQQADAKDKQADQRQVELDGLPLPQPGGGKAVASPAAPTGTPATIAGTSGNVLDKPLAAGVPGGSAPVTGVTGSCSAAAGPTCPQSSLAAVGACGTGDTALTNAADVYGTYENDSGERIVLSVLRGGKPGQVLWNGNFLWTGTFAAGKLNFIRFPKPEEMGTAPEWARKLATAPPTPTTGPNLPLGGPANGAVPTSPGFVQWDLELDAVLHCGVPTITGKFYPGSFKWSAQTDASGKEIESTRKVSDIGRGTPVDVRYVKVQPGIVDVAVLENQTRRDELPVASADGQLSLTEPGFAFYYPFQPGADDTGAALSTRNLLIYGYDLPRDRDGTITIVSDDPNIQYLVLAVQADWEINPLIKQRVDFGRRKGKASHSAAVGSEIDKMDGVLVRATLKRGVLPGFKTFTLNGAPAAWQLRFGDDVALISFARARNGSREAPAKLAADNVQPAANLFKPERTFIEVQTQGSFPLDTIDLRVAVDGAPVKWLGKDIITATRVAGLKNTYRTPAIDIETIETDPPDAYSIATDGSRIGATLNNPWLFRASEATARLLGGPGEIGHTFNYYLGRAAIADKVDPLPDLSTTDGWRQLSGRTADRLTDITILTGYFGNTSNATTWKEWFLDWHKKLNRPPWYYFVHSDDILPSIRVSVAEHAALLMLRDAFVAKVDAEVPRFQGLLDEYAKDPASAAFRGLRDYLKANGWDRDSPWRYISVTCPGTTLSGNIAGKVDTSATCSLPYALSDSFLKQTFGTDDRAADRWSLGATAEGLRSLISAGKDARDKARGLGETDIRGLLKVVGRNYEPLYIDLEARLMTRSSNGQWAPDNAATYSIKEIHQLTDAVAALDQLQTKDAIELAKLALLPVFMAAGPILIGEDLIAGEIINWGLYAATSTIDIGEAYLNLPDVNFALGASLAVGAEQLSEAIQRRDNIYFSTIETLAVSAISNYGASEVAKVGKSVIDVYGRPAFAAVKRGGLAAFKKLKRTAQEAVLAAILRSKGVQQSGQLTFASAFEQEAAAVGDVLLAEAKLPSPASAKTQTLQAHGNPAGESTVSLTLPEAPLEIDGEFFRVIDELNGNPAPATPAKPVDNTPWTGAPDVNSEVSLVAESGGTPLSFKLGERRGTGQYVWTLEIAAENGRVPQRPMVLKLANKGDYRADVRLDQRDFFSGREVVQNSEVGYKLVTDRTRIRVLETRFYPGGLRTGTSAVPTRSPFMVQEALGPSRRLLSEVEAAFGRGQLPQEVDDAITQLWADLRDAGIYAEDLNKGNVWVELKGANDAAWTSYFNTGRGSVEVGLLDFDRMVDWNDYVAGRAGKMGEFLNWVVANSMPARVKSMGRIFRDPVNQWLGLTTKNPAAFDALLKARRNAYLPGDLSYALEKQMERHGYVAFDEASQRVVTGTVKLDRVRRQFPTINDSSRFEPYPLLSSPPAAGSQQRRRRFDPQPTRRRVRSGLRSPSSALGVHPGARARPGAVRVAA